MMRMNRYEIFQARWNLQSLVTEAEDNGYKLRVIYILHFMIFLLDKIAIYFESED